MSSHVLGRKQANQVKFCILENKKIVWCARVPLWHLFVTFPRSAHQSTANFDIILALVGTCDFLGTLIIWCQVGLVLDIMCGFEGGHQQELGNMKYDSLIPGMDCKSQMFSYLHTLMAAFADKAVLMESDGHF